MYFRPHVTMSQRQKVVRPSSPQPPPAKKSVCLFLSLMCRQCFAHRADKAPHLRSPATSLPYRTAVFQVQEPQAQITVPGQEKTPSAQEKC